VLPDARGKYVRTRRSRPTTRAALAVCLALVIGGAGLTSASAASRNNAAPVYVQEQSNWCWAATSKSTVQFYRGVSATQCQMVKWGKASSSCDDVTGYFGADVSRTLLKAGLSGIGTTTGPMTFAAVRGEIDSGRVVMIRWGWSAGGGHMLVLRGYDTTGSKLSYINPLQSAYQSASHSWMQQYGTHTWTDSRYEILR
jgi:hypothetical protein